MKETFSTPHNPSEAFAKASAQENTHHYESVLDNEAAAYAAKPWMDVAVELHDAKNAAASDLHTGETVYDFDGQGSLHELVAYAERRARLAAEATRGDDLTQQETEMLDVFKAEVEMNGVLASFNIDDLSPEQVDTAYNIAKQRSKDAQLQGNMAESRKWNELARRTEKYNELIFNDADLDEEDRFQYESELRPDAKDAGWALVLANEDGTLSSDEALKYANRAKQDAKNMRSTAQLYRLFAEVQDGEQHKPSVETQEDNERHVVPNDPMERMDFARKFFVGENMTTENVPVLKEYLLKVLRSSAAEITKVQAERGTDVRYPNRLATLIGRTLPHELSQRKGPGVFLYEQIKDKMKVRDGESFKTVDFVDFNMMKMDNSLKQLGIDVRDVMPDFYDKFTA